MTATLSTEIMNLEIEGTKVGLFGVLRLKGFESCKVVNGRPTTVYGA
jgi:hypothetical protein